MSQPEKVHPWYRFGFMEAGGGDIEFVCLRCGHAVTITPRYGETPPSKCPSCGFAGGGRSLEAGDFLFQKGEDGLYHICRILCVDKETDTAHVTSYPPCADAPTAATIDTIEPTILHAPIAAASFSDWQWLARRALANDDLAGFHEYLKQTDFARYMRETGQDTDKIVAAARLLYNEAHALSRQQDYSKAIEKYHRAYELFPPFFEAKDNEAFCYMSLEDYQSAIDCFQESIDSNGHTFLTDFSIGECFFKMNDFKNALPWFNSAKGHGGAAPEYLAVLDGYIKAINSAG